MTMKKLTTEEFIEKANKIHNNKYDYSQVKYVNSRTKVCITCPQHNQFWQLANSHLQGQGCPKCKATKTQLKIFNTLCNSFPNEVWIWEYSNSWLGNQRIDIFNPRINLAIEYNGEQHYMPVSAFGGDLEFNKIRLRDKQKIKKLNDRNCIIYIIPYYEFNLDNIVK